VIAVLSSLGDIGVNVWNSYASGSQQRRMKYADYVANDFYDAVCSARPESRILFPRCELHFHTSRINP